MPPHGFYAPRLSPRHSLSARGTTCTPAVLLFIIAVVIALSVRGANVWEKFVILRIGKRQSVEGAGFFMRITIPDNVDAATEERIQTTSFNTEQAPTKDTCPSMSTPPSSGTSMTRRRPRSPLPTTGKPSSALRKPRCER
ncbi:hypothetical protein [Burkholderia ambifaria]|jgi:hypothetical protein|uniref:hypothetical protein n=1 Tax=Burkholderia ambifaria TaxID=152480 RepID=UPI0034933C18